MVALELPSFSRAAGRATAWCLARPAWILAATIALAVLAALAASRLRVDPSPETYLRGLAERDVYERIDRRFEIGQTIVVALHEPGGTVFDPETVEAVLELDRRFAALPGVKRVLSIGSATMLGELGDAAPDDTLDLGRLLPPGPVTAASATELGARIGRHRVYRRLLTDAPHETTFLLVQLDTRTTTGVERLVLVRSLRAEADRFETRARSIHLAGTPVTTEALVSAVQNDLVIFFPGALLLIVVLLWVMFGDPVASLIPIGVVGLSSLLVIGLFAVLGIPLNMATATVPLVLLVTGLADGVHFFAELRRQYGRTRDRAKALVQTVETIALPTGLTTLTAAVALLALSTTTIRPIRELGVGAVLGLVVAYAASMLLMPVLLAAFQYPRHRRQGLVGMPRMAYVLTGLALRGSRWIVVPVVIVAVVAGATAATLTRLEVTSDFLRYFDDDHRLRRDLAVIERRFGGTDSLEIIVDAKAPEAFLEPAAIARVDAATDAARAVDGVGAVFGFPDFLRLANGALTSGDGDVEPRYELPPTREATAQLLFLDAEGFRAFAADELRSVRMTAQIPVDSTRATGDLAGRIERAAAKSLEGSGLAVHVTGLPRLYAAVAEELVVDTAGSFALAAALVLLLSALTFRSVALAIAAWIPTVLPIGLTFAAMVMLGMTYDVNSAFVASLAVNIAVGNTVHVTFRYRRARDHGSPTPSTAVQYALTHAGQPVIFTAVLLATGFGIACMSPFGGTQKLGVLAFLLVGLSLFFNLGVLPTLLMAADRIGAAFEPDARSAPSAITGRFRDAAATLTLEPMPIDAAPDADDDDEPSNP
jgi:predicted RND superfamily exporter protein